MAIDEELGKSASLPPYPEMIMEAIEALKQKDGSDKSSISEYIESKYKEISDDHEDILEANLTSMKENGELLFVNNSYLKAGADAPVKRGRGRPPKPKDPSAPAPAPAPAAPAGSSRGRGRPRKDPSAPAAAKKAKTSAGPTGSGRPRGRPRKDKTDAVQNGVEV
ncbi:hypothetical protein ABFS83_11G097700 [Erythranthe nasuta]|uniref:H15 domain-containing protein n=1 Tax=Erythranthe guttata TaxID=4155 RepID=A0A022RZ46_ERYGU|nr:PREDICTED: HMG-Y-related protein A-like [Erythranthe guttata]EYU45802.1 hypothetical protein MIMGU_mgv1a015242mg [Erythranthe guttata]|eukprot:XP_012838405.1 PREDICTED: HMG-Y-related protein A-like [Erythranthe guttata]